MSRGLKKLLLLLSVLCVCVGCMRQTVVGSINICCVLAERRTIHACHPFAHVETLKPKRFSHSFTFDRPSTTIPNILKQESLLLLKRLLQCCLDRHLQPTIYTELPQTNRRQPYKPTSFLTSTLDVHPSSIRTSPPLAIFDELRAII